MNHIHQMRHTLVYRTDVAAYMRGHPGYPEMVARHIDTICESRTGKALELGCGSGKFTEILTKTFERVFVVEPNIPMRSALSVKYGNNVELIEGCAESVNYKSQQFDAVFCAQSFHWFRHKEALEEILRLLKPSGFLFLVWNVRDTKSPLMAELMGVVHAHRGSDVPRYGGFEWKKPFGLFTSELSHLEYRDFLSNIPMLIDDLISQLMSISYISQLTTCDRKEVEQVLRRVLANHIEQKQHGIDMSNTEMGHHTVAVRYRTDLYWCQKQRGKYG